MVKREPVVVIMSVLAALQFFFGGWSGIEALNHDWVMASIGAVGTLAVAASQVGVQFYVRGQVTPVEDARRIALAPDGGHLPDRAT